MSATPESRCFVIRKQVHFCLKLRTRGGRLKRIATTRECNLCVPDKGDMCHSYFLPKEFPSQRRLHDGVSPFGVAKPCNQTWG